MFLRLDNFCNPALKHRAMDSLTKLTSILSLNLAAISSIPIRQRSTELTPKSGGLGYEKS